MSSGERSRGHGSRGTVPDDPAGAPVRRPAARLEEDPQESLTDGLGRTGLEGGVHGDCGGDALARARDACLRRLGRREYTRRQLLDWLRARDHDPDVARAALDELADAGYQSDARYCEAAVARHPRDDRGPWYIREALRRDGIDDDLIDRELPSDREFWSPRLRELIARRDLASLPAWPDRARAGERLVRRGFPTEWVRAHLDLDD